MTPFELDNLKPSLSGKKILIGITASIAAFKIVDVIRYLKACNAEVRVLFSENADQFVTKTTIETLSENKVLDSMWSDGTQGTHHIDTARWADLFLIAPASANTIAKITHGFASDLLSTEALAFQGPMLIAPAMNPAMWSNPATESNVTTLKSRGIEFLGPVSGVTACKEEGDGRMVEPKDIVTAVATRFFKKTSKTALVTLGPTRSPLDPVRYLTNRSSGLMGASLVWALEEKGYAVTAICGPTSIDLPPGTTRIDVITADEMYNATLEHFPNTDLFIATAAVLDWDFSHTKNDKIKKTGSIPRVSFSENKDILAAVSEQKQDDQFILGFAAETNQPISNGIKKLQRKGCNAIFVNNVSKQGFETETNSGWFVRQKTDSVIQIPVTKKSLLARKIIDLCEGALPKEAVEIQTLNSKKLPKEIHVSTPT